MEKNTSILNVFIVIIAISICIFIIFGFVFFVYTVAEKLTYGASIKFVCLYFSNVTLRQNLRQTSWPPLKAQINLVSRRGDSMPRLDLKLFNNVY